jgi:endonuclease-8
MPEGPEIARAARQLATGLAGRVADAVELHFPELRRFEERLAGRLVDRVEARGKALLIRFEGGWNLYSHNQLYGRWYLRPARDLPRTGRSLRVAIHNERHSALLYSASDVAVLRDAELAQHPFLQKLGPDVLDGAVTAADVLARLRDPRFHRRRLTALLLDQGFLSGLGNYLRSEVLFVARVPPAARPCDLDEGRLEALAEACLDLSRRSLRTGGITNDPDLVRALRAAGWTRSELRFSAFAREGEPCHLCGDTILRTEAGSRRLYHCPTCQRSG